MKEHLEKCLLCPRPSCTSCPAGTQIRDAIKLIRDGKHDEAGALLFENNPLSAITGAVCPNHLYCKSSCVLGRKNNAVDFGKIERVISAKYLDTLLNKPSITSAPSPSSKNVLIAGSGPAGLSLAFYLRRKGYNVTVFEREQEFGGMLRYGIPNFRLDKTLIDKLTAVLTKRGINLVNNKKVDLSNIEAYQADFDIIVLAIGACVPKNLGLEGEDLPHVWTAVSFLRFSQNPPMLGSFNSAVVIGGGNVAIDCALAASHANPDAAVKMCYRRAPEDLKCYPEELQLAKERGVELEFHMVPKCIKNDKVVFERDGKEISVPADLVVTAIGQQALGGEQKTAVETERGLIKTDEFKTNLENVYAIGDAVTGTQTIIKAVAAAKRLAELI